MKFSICVLAVLASTLAFPIEETVALAYYVSSASSPPVCSHNNTNSKPEIFNSEHFPIVIRKKIDWHRIKPINMYVEAVEEAPPVIGNRVIGGQVAPRNGYPYQAALIMDRFGFCGGSLISRNIVLTAAHCIDSAEQTQVILGAHSPRAVEPTQRIDISRDYMIHPRWNRALSRNDIAMIRIAAVYLTPQIQLIALAPANSSTFAGQTGVLTGWGRTSDRFNSLATELKYVYLQIITNDVCRNSFGDRVQPHHICTSGQGRVGGCNGDSGGPLVVNGVEVGIVSYGSRHCEQQLPTAFVRVSYFRDWIRETVGV